MNTIEWILRLIGIYPHRNGYYYIRDMVRLTLETNSVTMKPLYEKVAQMHNVSVHSVQNGIRKACEAAFNSQKHLNLNIILDAKAADEHRQLTNSEVIFLISCFVKSEAARTTPFSQIYNEKQALWR